VVNSYNRLNTGSNQGVNKPDIEIDTCLVNWIVTTTEGNDTGPCDGKAVGFGTVALEERNIFLPAVV